MSMKDKAGQEVVEMWMANGPTHALIRAPTGCRMVLENEYHGTYDEDWIVCYGSDGKENSRHNAAYCSTIIWA